MRCPYASSVVRHLCFATWPPAHLVHRRAGAPVDRLTRNDEALFLIEANGAQVVRVDVQVESLRRYLFGARDERRSNRRSPGFRRHDDLIEIEAVRVDRD